MINWILAGSWMLMLCLQIYSNYKAIKSNKKVSKQLTEDIEARKKFIKVSNDLVIAAERKSTAQDNYLWKCILILAKRINELENNHYV